MFFVEDSVCNSVWERCVGVVVDVDLIFVLDVFVWVCGCGFWGSWGWGDDDGGCFLW